MKRIFKLLSLFLIVTFLFNTAMPVQARSSEKSKVIKATQSYFFAVKQYNKKKISNSLDNKQFLYWNDIPVMQRHIRNLNKKYLTYDIKSVKIKGNSATVTAKVSFYSSYEDSKKAMREVLNVFSKNTSGAKMIKQYAKELKSAYSDNLYYFPDKEEFYDQFIFTNTTKIPLVKKNGKWKVAKVTSRMQYQMDCVTSDFWKDFDKNLLIIY